MNEFIRYALLAAAAGVIVEATSRYDSTVSALLATAILLAVLMRNPRIMSELNAIMKGE